MKRYVFGLLMLAAMAGSVHAQFLVQQTWATNPLNKLQGKIIQYGIVAGDGAWYPTQQAKALKPFCSNNCAEIQTVNGVSQLFVTDSHDFCKPVCTYSGTFVDLRNEQITQHGATFWKVSGGLIGTFTDPHGIVTENVPARYYFETFPSTDGTYVPAGGNLTVVLALN